MFLNYICIRIYQRTIRGLSDIFISLHHMYNVYVSVDYSNQKISDKSIISLKLKMQNILFQPYLLNPFCLICIPKYSYPHELNKNISVTDGLHIQQWSHKMIFPSAASLLVFVYPVLFTQQQGHLIPLSEHVPSLTQQDMHTLSGVKFNKSELFFCSCLSFPSHGNI